MKFTYNQLAEICLKADGGYCHSCADDVAEGFAEQDSSINLEKLKKVIETKMQEHYKESERKYQEWRTSNPKIKINNKDPRFVGGFLGLLIGSRIDYGRRAGLT